METEQKEKTPKLVPATEEEKKLHTEALKEILKEKYFLEEGFKAGHISKSQMKKGLAANFNKKNNYMTEHLIWNILGTMMIWKVD